MQKAYDFYEDPGHGWLKVPTAELIALGIADKITQYSYQREEFAYLEEDCDATLFIKTMETKGISIKFRYHTATNDSRIRLYAQYIAKPIATLDCQICDPNNCGLGLALQCGAKDPQILSTLTKQRDNNVPMA